MSYLVLARKWRPQTFDEIVGQEHVVQTLMNAIRSDRVAHAFLFTGVRGVGKTTAARVLAKALNCVKGPTPTPCNDCVNCREITAGNAVDVLEIDGASNTGVDDVREIIENVRYQPAKSRFKIYIIDEVHMLSTSAFNALLKTLEEPPPHVKFIFATTDPHKVPHTIHSRCQRYDFKRIPFRLIADRLAQIARSEGIAVSALSLALIAREGEGSMRDAQSLFDQVIAFAGKAIGDEDVITALGLADRKLLYGAAEAILDRNPAGALERFDELHRYGYDMRRLARELLEHFRNLAVARLLPDVDLLSELPDEERAEVGRQAQKWSSEDLDRAFRLLLGAEGEVGRVPYPKLVLEMTLIKLATLTPVVPVSALLDRIGDLERRLNGRPPAAGSPIPPAGEKAPAPREVANRPQRTAAVPESSAPSPSPAPAQPAGPHTWNEFLNFVGKEKITLLPYLKSSQPVNCDGPELTLRVPQGYYYDYLAQRDHAGLVEDMARRFFGRPMRLTVKTPEGAPEPAPAAPEPPAALHAAALGNPVVRAAVEILGGEVQEVKSRPRRERGSK
ncbi:MAG TPA: DNA polymerase III subunit gamma/tau [Candidatus Binatia bacterium]|jgi:DNA polymerase III subunit gamma/tau